MRSIIGISATIAATTAFLRRRVSKNWIDVRSNKQDLSNRVILITGGNVGLGYHAATDFAKRNAQVIIACRNVEKGMDAVESIQRSTGNLKVDCMHLDLSSLDSVKEFIERVKLRSEVDSIDTLICNAGVWVPDPKDPNEQKDPIKYKTKDGYEIHFGVNHLSHFLIAKEMVDILQRSQDGRIIFVSSSLMKSGKLDFNKYDHIYEGRQEDPLQEEEEDNDDGRKKKKKKASSFGAPKGYCDTKLMNALTVRMLSKEYPSISSYAICPGFCRSSLGRHVSMSFLQKLMFAPIMLLIQRTPTQGAQNIVFAAIEEKEKLKSGEFFRDGEIAVEQTDFVDGLGENVAKKLWDISQDLLSKSSL